MDQTELLSPTPSITISYTRLIARYLVLQGKGLHALLDGTKLQTNCLTDESILLTKEQQIQIIRNAIQLSGDRGFGLHFGQFLSPMTLGPVGFLANSSPDLLTAIKALQKYLPARVNFAHLDLSNNDQYLKCRFVIDFSGEKNVYRCLVECLSLTLLSLVEFILGKPLVEGKLCYNYPPPDYIHDYNNYISCALQFGANESFLLIPTPIVKQLNAASDHANYEFALRQCEAMEKQLKYVKGHTHKQVQELLLTYPPGQLKEADIASELFICKRTLARRLAQEGTGFKQLRDEFLSTLAASYLEDTQLSVESISSLLNYYSGSNFRRAFKRWFKMTPEAYRKQLITPKKITTDNLEE